MGAILHGGSAIFATVSSCDVEKITPTTKLDGSSHPLSLVDLPTRACTYDSHLVAPVSSWQTPVSPAGERFGYLASVCLESSTCVSGT